MIAACEQKGKIIETGSNENGKWVKWDDGTMRCSDTSYYGVTTFQTMGAMFYGYLQLKDFPKEFIEVPDIIFSHHDGGNVICLQPYGLNNGGVSKTSPGGVYPISPVKIEQPCSIAVTYIAEGKWK